jgi:hypothetical protein
MHLQFRLNRIVLALVLLCTPAGAQQAGQGIEHPYRGITLIRRSISPPDLPRAVHMKIVQIDLTSPGIRFKLTPPAGKLEVVNQTTLDFMVKEGAQLAFNCHFYLPVGTPETNLIGLAASEGTIYSGFETPEQSYAIVDHAPAFNIDQGNHAEVVHADLSYADGKHILEKAKIWNALSGSAQIITAGIKTIPVYRDAAHPEGALTPDGKYSNDAPNGTSLGSWYDVPNPRTVIGLSRDRKTLTILIADGRGAGGSRGLTGSETADILIRDYGVYDALNLDGGGSTTLAMRDPATGAPAIINVPSVSPPRPVGSSLAVFARGREDEAAK